MIYGSPTKPVLFTLINKFCADPHNISEYHINNIRTLLYPKIYNKMVSLCPDHNSTFNYNNMRIGAIKNQYGKLWIKSSKDDSLQLVIIVDFDDNIYYNKVIYSNSSNNNNYNNISSKYNSSDNISSKLNSSKIYKNNKNYKSYKNNN